MYVSIMLRHNNATASISHRTYLREANASAAAGRQKEKGKEEGKKGTQLFFCLSLHIRLPDRAERAVRGLGATMGVE